MLLHPVVCAQASLIAERLHSKPAVEGVLMTKGDIWSFRNCRVCTDRFNVVSCEHFRLFGISSDIAYMLLIGTIVPCYFLDFFRRKYRQSPNVSRGWKV